MARWWLVLATALPAASLGEDLNLRLPAVNTSLSFGDQPVMIAAAVTISGRPNSLEDIFRVLVTADMADLQEHITAILKSQLDTEERCGDRLSVINAALAPADPAGSLKATVHYERWVCVKMLGKEVNKKLLGGDGQIPVNLTPSIQDKQLKLTAEVGTIEAKGALGEVLRSPAVRDRLRERLKESLESALLAGTNLKTMLPPGLERVASMVSARFADAGAGRLAFELRADVRMPAAQIRALVTH